jgi:hypothetical protein
MLAGIYNVADRDRAAATVVVVFEGPRAERDVGDAVNVG